MSLRSGVLGGTVEGGENRVYWWSSPCEPKRTTFLRHGRWHLIAKGVGRRRFYVGRDGVRGPNYGQRSDVQINLEWSIIGRYRFGLGGSFKWGTNGSETTPDISLHFGPLGSLYIQFAGVVPYRWLERHKPNGDVDYDTRVFSANVSLDHRDGAPWDVLVQHEFWAKQHEWSRNDPWWMRSRLSLRKFLFGRDVHSSTVREEGTCVVPMPEANYPATYKIIDREWRYPKPLGRLRDVVVGVRRTSTTEIEPGKPVPVPGKGENSWDCGDDGIYSMSVGGESVPTAIGKLVSSALATRKRHGGEGMSIA